MTLDASFRELEPYYSRGVSKNSLQGESSSEENGGGHELLSWRIFNKRVVEVMSLLSWKR